MGTAGWDWPFGARGRGDWSRGRRTGQRRPHGQPPDAWGDAAEAYPGAATLAEAAGRVGAEGADGAGAWSAAVARLAVAQLALTVAERPPSAGTLETARLAATEYVRQGGCGPAEARALATAAALASPEPVPALALALCEAGAAAAGDGCPGGASTLWRAAYRLAQPRRWEEAAALAAAGLEALARAGGSRAATRLWRGRATRHARRGGGIDR